MATAEVILLPGWKDSQEICVQNRLTVTSPSFFVRNHKGNAQVQHLVTSYRPWELTEKGGSR